MEKNDVINIYSAIEESDLKTVKRLLVNNNLIHFMTPFGSWLHVACMEGSLEIVKLLIEFGIDINAIGGVFNAGAINRAASEGQLDIVQYLLDYGAELDTSEPDKNPLFAAIYGGHKKIVQLLLDHGIDASVKYTGDYMKNMDAYDFAVERGQLEIAEMLKPYRE